MSLYSISRDYEFVQFRFDWFNEGKYYKVIDASNKYAYDYERGKPKLDEIEGVKLLLQVGLDTQVMKVRGEEQTGVNEGTIIQVTVLDGKLEDYQKYVAQGGFNAKEIPVEVYDYDESTVNYYDGNRDKPALTLVGKIKETKLPDNQVKHQVGHNQNGTDVKNKQVDEVTN